MFHRVCQCVFGQDRHAAKKLEEGRIHIRRDNAHGQRIKICDCKVFTTDLKHPVGDPVELRIVHEFVPSEGDVLSRQRLAIAPAHPRAELERPALLIRRNGPRFGQTRACFLSGLIEMNERNERAN